MKKARNSISLSPTKNVEVLGLVVLASSVVFPLLHVFGVISLFYALLSVVVVSVPLVGGYLFTDPNPDSLIKALRVYYISFFALLTPLAIYFYIQNHS
jgi:hypothetical protein